MARAIETEILKDMGKGVILRRATEADTDALAAFNALMHTGPGNPPDEGIAVWTRDLMRGDHPTTGPGDFVVAEDTATGEIVSTVNLISQVWSYEGIPFKLGRPELVATHPDYRRRGLVRAQMDIVHSWSEERGEMVQAITGIPWYYRQFGYEMGLELGGGRTGYKTHVIPLPEGESEPYTLRAATDADIPLMKELYEYGSRRYKVAAVRDQAMWSYMLHGPSPESYYHDELRIIEASGGEPVGFLAHKIHMFASALEVTMLELKPGASWFEVTPPVVRYMMATAEEYVARKGKGEAVGFHFAFGSSHPVFDAFDLRMPRVRPPYAYFVRVPDLAAFIMHIAPALNARLQQSPHAGYSGELTLNFFRDGLKINIEKGAVTDVERRAYEPDDGMAAFPDYTFLHLLFGHRSLKEIEDFLPDCRVKTDDARTLLNTLFPKQPSLVVSIG